MSKFGLKFMIKFIFKFGLKFMIKSGINKILTLTASNGNIVARCFVVNIIIMYGLDRLNMVELLER